jgi:hypothetical protein
MTETAHVLVINMLSIIHSSVLKYLLCVTPPFLFISITSQEAKLLYLFDFNIFSTCCIM